MLEGAVYFFRFGKGVIYLFELKFMITRTLLFWLLLLSCLLAPLDRLFAAEVNVYSFRQPFLIQPLFDDFTRKTGIKVNMVFAEKGLVERLRQEGRNSPADLLLTTDVSWLGEAEAAGVLQPVRTPTLEANVPSAWRHPQGLWYGLSMRARVIFAAKGRVRPGEITTYAQLADPRFKGRICSRSSLHDYNVSLLAAQIAHLGEDRARAWAAGLLANLAHKPQGNDRSQVRAIKEGECDLALVNTYYMGKMLDDPEQKSWAEAVYLIFPDQNGNGAHVNISGAGITQAAPHKAEAIRLLEFLTGLEAQRLYAELNYEYPIRPGVAWSPVVTSWGRFKPDTMGLESLIRNRALAIRIYDQVGYQ